jgi:hypothetical protein
MGSEFPPVLTLLESVVPPLAPPLAEVVYEFPPAPAPPEAGLASGLSHGVVKSTQLAMSSRTAAIGAR